MVDITIDNYGIHGVYKPTNIIGGPHPVAYFQRDSHYIDIKCLAQIFRRHMMPFARWSVDGQCKMPRKKHLARGFKRGWSIFFDLPCFTQETCGSYPLVNVCKTMENRQETKHSSWNPEDHSGQTRWLWASSQWKASWSFPVSQPHAGNDQRAGNSRGRGLWTLAELHQDHELWPSAEHLWSWRGPGFFFLVRSWCAPRATCQDREDEDSIVLSLDEWVNPRSKSPFSIANCYIVYQRVFSHWLWRKPTQHMTVNINRCWDPPRSFGSSACCELDRLKIETFIGRVKT